MKALQSSRPKMFNPEDPESFVNGKEHGSGFDDVCETFLGRDYNDSDLDAVNKFLQEEAMA